MNADREPPPGFPGFGQMGDAEIIAGRQGVAAALAALAPGARYRDHV